MQKATLTWVTWSDVREEVHKVNPGLATQIDNIDPSNKLKLLKARYPFGELILKSGELQLANKEGQLVSRYDNSIDNSIKEALAYTPTMPVGVVINNIIDMHWHRDNTIIPWFMMRPGRIFALWGLMQDLGTSAQTVTLWNITSGSRSLITLPKISDALGYKRLKKEFGLTAAMPTGLLDQWDLLKELTDSPQFDYPWSSEVIFFTAPWYKKMRDGSWKDLEYYLLKSAWQETSYLRDEGVFNFVFSRALTDKNMRPNPYLTDIAKHVYAIVRGCYPGYKIASDEVCAPIKRLEQIFDQVYQHKFAPTFVHPGYFDPTNPLNPVYYSLEVPALFDYSPKSRKAANKMNDIREVKHIHTIINKFIEENKESLMNTAVYKIVNNISYEYYHSDMDTLNELKNTDKLCDIDEGMQKNKDIYNKSICTTSPFLRGCVRMGIKSSSN